MKFLSTGFSEANWTATHSQHDEYRKSIEDMAANSLRCVAFAYCSPDAEMIPKEDIANWKLPEDDLILLGIVGIKVVTVLLLLS